MGLDKFDAVINGTMAEVTDQAHGWIVYASTWCAFRGEETLDLVASTKIGEMALMADNDLPLPRTL